METIFGIILFVSLLVGVFEWLKQEADRPKGFPRDKLRKCPACGKLSTIIEVYYDAEEGEKQLLHCLAPNCNARFRNWETPPLEERQAEKHQKEIIDLADKRARQQKMVLTRMTNNLKELASEVLITKNNIRKTQTELIQAKEGTTVDLPLVTPAKPDPINFESVQEAAYVLGTMVAPSIVHQQGVDEYDFPTEDEFAYDNDFRDAGHPDEPQETVNEADRIALAELITDIRNRT